METTINGAGQAAVAIAQADANPAAAPSVVEVNHDKVTIRVEVTVKEDPAFNQNWGADRDNKLYLSKAFTGDYEFMPEINTAVLEFLNRIHVAAR